MKMSPNIKYNVCNCLNDIDEYNVAPEMKIKKQNSVKNNKIISFYNSSNKHTKTKSLF